MENKDVGVIVEEEGGFLIPENIVEKIVNFGITINTLEAYKKLAFKKYHRRFGWKWLNRKDKQQALLNQVLSRKPDIKVEIEE